MCDLVLSIRHAEGELVRVFLFFTGVDILDTPRHQVSLGETTDTTPCWDGEVVERQRKELDVHLTNVYLG